jgi:glyoxylase-like metal-dependent hydrolase (beta-lactamase superfamily II)
MKPLTLGRLSVTAIVERAGPTRPTWLLPDATPEAVERHCAWLAPHFIDDRGRFLQSIHAVVVRAPGLTVLIDTCVGNDKDRGGRAPFHMMHTPFLEDLAAAGVAPESVDLVLCTHLHVDHVGWNGDGEAVITGDLMHCPIQVAEPDWSSHFDSDPSHARATRRAFCQRYADTHVTVRGAHFHHPTAGRIVRHDAGWRFQVDTLYRKTDAA